MKWNCKCDAEKGAYYNTGAGSGELGAANIETIKRPDGWKAYCRNCGAEIKDCQILASNTKEQ